MLMICVIFLSCYLLPQFSVASNYYPTILVGRITDLDRLSVCPSVPYMLLTW